MWFVKRQVLILFRTMANLCLFTWCILCIWQKHLLIWVWIIYRIDSRDMLVASDPRGLFSVVSHRPWTISHQTLCHLQHVRGAVNKNRHSYSDRHYLRLQAVPSFWQNPSCRSEKNQWKKIDASAQHRNVGVMHMKRREFCSLGWQQFFHWLFVIWAIDFAEKERVLVD